VPGAVAALAVASALGLMLRVESEMKKGILVLTGDQVDIAAAAAIAAAGTSVRDILLPPKSETAIPAVSGLYVDPDFVNKNVSQTVLSVWCFLG
jgi:hypothetical protein